MTRGRKGLGLDAEHLSLLRGPAGPDEAATAAPENMTVKAARPRHDETRVPRKHKRAVDDWPVHEPTPGPRVTPLTDDDRALFRETVEAWAYGARFGVTDEARRAVRKAYRALAGHAWGERCTAWLALMLRQRGQACVAESIRAHRRGKGAPFPAADGRPDVAMTGAEIVSRLRAMATTQEKRGGAPAPAWLADERLVSSIDNVADKVSIGGGGGPKGGRTPETLAKAIVAALSGHPARGLKRRRAANS